jgi:hypothetical protein
MMINFQSGIDVSVGCTPRTNARDTGVDELSEGPDQKAGNADSPNTR